LVRDSEQIGAADDADQPTVSEHRQPLDPPPMQESGDLIGRRVGCDENQRRAHDVAHPKLDGFGRRRREGDPREHLQPPFAAVVFRAAAKQIAVADHADWLACGVHDWRSANASLQHQTRGILDGCVRRNGDYLVGHQLAGDQRRVSRFDAWRRLLRSAMASAFLLVAI
jgi:hypothetical protein